jgi:hypothetical protein
MTQAIAHTGIRRRRPGAAAVAWLVTAAMVAATAASQGSPSGEYGDLALGESVEGTLAAIQGDEVLVYHTYVVEIPAGSGPVTVSVEGFGSDIDLALKLGAPILTYEDVDYIDVSEDPNPSHTLAAPPAGPLYVDVMNLLPAPASYRLSVTAAATDGAPRGPAATGVNPLAPGGGDPLLGTFEGDGLRVTVRSRPGGYEGELTLGGQAYAYEAGGEAGQLVGVFVAGGNTFAFSATLAGDVLTVESGGARYRTRRMGDAPEEPRNPLGGGAGSGSTPDDPVLARGAHATLTRDNADAFIDALAFSLAQAGYQEAVSEADRRAMLEALAGNFPSLGAAEQAILSQAREVWARVQAHWPSASAAEREEFVIGVFVLAFGEEAVRQAIGGGPGGTRAGGGAGGGPASCGTIDECMSTYAPEAYQDTINAQGCWAAAGCESYDPEFNTFTYDSYDGN